MKKPSKLCILGYMVVIERKISELIPAEYNPRRISDEALEHLKASIQRFDTVKVKVNGKPYNKKAA